MNRLTLEDMQDLASQRNGKCLSTEYRNGRTRLKWQCEKGHIWEARPDNIKSNNSWCSICTRQLPRYNALNIEDMHEIASKRGGICLSTEYINTNNKLKWQCDKGHIWWAIPNNIKNQNSWCPYCSNTATLTIKIMQEIAAYKGGKCLSTEYKNAHTRLKWQCDKGHIWDGKPNNIRSGAWCPYCSHRMPQTLKEMQEIAAYKGGKCLSTEYAGANEKLKWQCDKGHIWEANPGSVKSKTWCPACANYLPLGIEEMQKIASERGGKCLSKEYISNSEKLKWQCIDGHVWWAVPNSIKQQKSWCPKCHESIGESICRTFFEILFETEFVKIKPSWLHGENQAKLELDGCSEKLKIAFEHQGVHHFRGNIFNNTRDSLEKTKQRDKIKLERCEEMGVKLFIIPEIPRLLAIQEVESFIRTKAEFLKVDVPRIKKVDLNNINFYSRRSVLNPLRLLAISKGGILVSSSHIDSRKKLEWRCADGHTWKATAYSVKNKADWCPSCKKIEKKSAQSLI